jgi:hypothetical protein
VGSHDGGPAFHVSFKWVGQKPDEKLVFDHVGVTVRDYFAAHAPAVPDWFVYREPNPPTPPPAADLDDFDAKWARDISSDDCPEESLNHHDVKPERAAKIRDYARVYGAYWTARLAHLDRQAINRIVAWRYAYADAMLAARGDAGMISPPGFQDPLVQLRIHDLEEALTEAERLLREVAKQKEAYPNWAKAYEAAADRAAATLAPKPLSPQLGGFDPGPAAGRGPGLPPVSPTPGLSPAGGREDGRSASGPGGSSPRKEQA